MSEQISKESKQSSDVELPSSAEVREQLLKLQGELTKSSGERREFILGNALFVIASYLVRSKVPERVYTKWLSNILEELPQIGEASVFDDFVTSLVEQNFSENNTAEKWHVLGGSGIARLQFTLSNGVLTTTNLDNFPDVELLHDAGILCSVFCQHISNS